MAMNCNYKECPDNVRGVCRHNIFCISDQEEIISLTKKIAEKENIELDSFTNPKQGMGGYQPDGHTKLDPGNPPKGGSGVPNKVNSGHFSNVILSRLDAEIEKVKNSNLDESKKSMALHYLYAIKSSAISYQEISGV